MERFSLQSFVKVCLLDTGGKIAELQKKLEPSNGYDFYNTFNRAVRAYCDDKSSSKPGDILSVPTRDVERKLNEAAFNAFKGKFGTKRSLETIKNPISFVPDNANFEIFVDPVFGFEKAGSRLAYLPWTIQKPALNQRYAAIACYIMRQAYMGTKYGNWQFNVCDLNSGKNYTENQITDNTPKILAADARMISNFLLEL